MGNKSQGGQVISLPKGGGALQGLGEKFSPDLHTGTGNLSVPLSLPPGRNGLQPQLSLVYSTGNGNGPFGMGWDLNTPGISRKTSRGVPRYLDRKDTFLLSGAEDLVAVAEDDRGASYRPRTEGLFARIEHHTGAGTDHWLVRGKDGLINFYGTPERVGDDPAVVADPADRRKIYGWKLTRTADPFGNSIVYDYERDAGETSDHIWDQLYLKRIRYADYTDADNAEKFLVSVTFAYEERPDPFSEYRAGFEIRTRKRCSRIEVRTHADNDQVARVYHLGYLDQGGLPPERLPLNAASLLGQVVIEGRNESASEALPPLEFGYTSFEPARRRYRAVTAVKDSLPERSLGDPAYELVDLFGNGLPDVIHMNGVARYWRNLGGGRFDAPRIMETAPASVRLDDPGVQLADANGNGRADLIVLDGARSGFYPLTFAGGWDRRGFVRYRRAPSVNLDAADVRLLDLDGDGVTDALRTGPNFELYYSDPEAGWSGVEVRERTGPGSFPDVTFGDARVKLGDLTGDGLQDVALIHNGRVEYWPYLGYGRWGRRVLMRNSPRFDDAAFFPGIGYDPKRLLIGDVDGDGAADLVYVSSGHVTVWINQGGNAWSEPITIHGTPPVTGASAVRLADLLGNGTDGILWTYDVATFRDSTYKFLDLTDAVKPYLLDRMDNHLGAVTNISYAPSTRFYLQDQVATERRWVTPLPFPVQVVARVEVIDQISRGKLTSEYRYHHGYWDGVEREFRGFGMVEQLDTETFADYHAPSGVEVDEVIAAHFSPPMLTKTWFHQGPVDREGGGWFEPDRSSEYWPGDPPALSQAEAINGFLQSLPDGRARRDALRTLRGNVLRTELYALDGSDRQARPYTVTEHAYGLREESAPGGEDRSRPRIFFPHMAAQRTTQWERGDEPMTQLAFTDDFDAYGQPRSRLSLSVPRGRDYRAAAAAEPYLGVQSVTTYAQRDDSERFLVDRVCGISTFEIVNDGRMPARELERAVHTGAAERRRIAQSFNYYDGDAFVGLPHGEIGDFGALTRSETLVLTEEILSEAHGGAAGIPPYLRPGGAPDWSEEYPAEFRAGTPSLAGYTFADGSDHRARGYFVQSSRVAFDAQVAASASRRGLPVEMLDSLGSHASVRYDRFQLLPVSVTDAVGLTTTAVYDYRVMLPRQTVDPNGNVSRYAFTPHGLVKEVFIGGKAGADEGDVGQAGTRFDYDFQAFHERRQPISARSVRREHHDTDADVAAGERDATVAAVEYSDGFGRLIQTRLQAEDLLFDESVLPADQSDAGGTSAAVIGRRPPPGGGPNVLVSGWQVHDNKGRVVEQYEPFFATGWDFAPRAEAQRGQKVTMFYDPRGQLIRAVNPDGSELRVIYGIPQDLADPDLFAPTPWEAHTYDANDNAGRTHADPSQSYAHHWNTPSSVVIDAMGRAVLAVARNRDASGEPVEEYRARSTYDIRGNRLTLTDELGRQALTQVYDLADRPLRAISIDAGVRVLAFDAIGVEVERRDGKGAVVMQTYDILHRPSRLWARDGSDDAPTLRQVVEYGDEGRADQDPQTRAARRLANCLGRPVRHYDGAGRLTIEAYDFKGGTLEKVREVIGDAELLAAFSPGGDAAPGYRVDWQPAPGGTLEDRAAALLDSRPYRTSLTYDAMGRPKSMRYPRDEAGERKTLLPRYNRGGTLKAVTLDGQSYVSHLAYNAKGQRTLLARGNGVVTRYAYDPQTFQLKRLRSERFTSPDPDAFQPAGSVLQDSAYDYDLSGNVLRIAERVPGCGVLNNADALLEADPALRSLTVAGDALARVFVYDAVYRLTSATGRESAAPAPAFSWVDDPQRAGYNSPAHGTLNQDNAPGLTASYREGYRYDAAGNLLQLKRDRATNGFTRDFRLAPDSNRLQKVEVGQNPFTYRYDENGNVTRETESRHFFWDYGDRLKAFATQAGGSEPSVQALYLYDVTGRRVKKLVRKQGGALASTVYVDETFEHNRWQASGSGGDNNYLNVTDDQQRIALVRVGQARPDDRGPAAQFPLDDHLGSAHVVADAGGAFVNREEFTPYGESSFGGFAFKRYRYTGRERDEESGLAYHGARYYLPWLGRWLSPDDRLTDGANLYAYGRQNPLRFVDPEGAEAKNKVVEEFVNQVQEYYRRMLDVSTDSLPNAKGPFRNAKIGSLAGKQVQEDLEAIIGKGKFEVRYSDSSLTRIDISMKEVPVDLELKKSEAAIRSGQNIHMQKYAKENNRLLVYVTGDTDPKYHDYTKKGLNKGELKSLEAMTAKIREKNSLLAAKTVNVKSSSAGTSTKTSTTTSSAGKGGRRLGRAVAEGIKKGAANAFVAGAVALNRGLPWLDVAMAEDEGSAGFAILMMYGCRAGPKVCAAAALATLTLTVGAKSAEARQGMIDSIRAMYPDDPRGKEAEDMIKMSCLYPTAACRQ